MTEYTPEMFRGDLRSVHDSHESPIIRRKADAALAVFDDLLARVRRDAAREALDGLARAEADMYLTRCQGEDYRGAAWCEHARHVAEEYRDTHYPEEED